MLFGHQDHPGVFGCTFERGVSVRNKQQKTEFKCVYEFISNLTIINVFTIQLYRLFTLVHLDLKSANIQRWLAGRHLVRDTLARIGQILAAAATHVAAFLGSV